MADLLSDNISVMVSRISNLYLWMLGIVFGIF